MGRTASVLTLAAGLLAGRASAQDGAPPVPEAARPRPLASFICGKPLAPPAAPPIDPLLKPVVAATPAAPAAPAATGPSGRAAPALVLDIAGPDRAAAGQPLEYTITVRNTGPAPAFHVRVEQELPAGVRYLGGEPAADQPGDRLVWGLGILDAGASRTLVARVRPGDEGEVLTTATVSFSASASARTEVVRPKLGVAVSGPADAAAGETVTFTVQLTNAGSGPADGVRLRARLPQGLSHPQGDYIEAELGDLPPGGTRTVRLPVTAARAGSHKCEVSASTAGGLYASDAASVRVVEPGLELRQHGPTSVALGGEAELHLDLTNPGSAPGKAVTVAMHLPEGLDFLGAANGGAYDPAGRRVLWQVDALPPGPPVRLTARARASAVGTVRSRSVARAGDLQAGAEAVVRVEGVPQAGLEVVDLDDPVRQGAETNYEIRVANVGSVPLTQLRVTAELPDCLELRAAGGPVPYHPEVSAVAFDPLDRLGVQADAVYRVRVRAAAAGTARVRVKLTCAELPDPLVQEQTTRVTAGP